MTNTEREVTIAGKTMDLGAVREAVEKAAFSLEVEGFEVSELDIDVTVKLLTGELKVENLEAYLRELDKGDGG